MGYDVSGTEISERPVRFEGDDFLQFKHRYGRRWVMTMQLNESWGTAHHNLDSQWYIL